MKKLFSFFLLLFIFAGYSQELPQVVPVSPEAASLGKYGEIPVNLATGKINYTVPIYTIDVGGFQWPIYLSYNYNGLMVEQDPPMTGLGWDLMATGRITRQVRGIPDEKGNGNNNAYKENTIIPYLQWDHSASGYPISSLNNIYENIVNSAQDGQHDKYHINAGSLSGSYVINEDDMVIFLNHKNYIVNSSLTAIDVIDENGIHYFFEQTEDGDLRVNTPEGGSPIETIPISYLLTKIELPNNRGTIDFHYYPTISYSKEVISETEVTGTGLGTTLNTVPTMTTVRSTHLEKIVFPNGEVRFNVSTAMDNTIQTAALNSVSVWHGTSEILSYNFAYSNATKNFKTLNSLTKNGGSSTLPWYSFEYHSFPSSMDYRSQDFWGFYNAKSNANLINGDKSIDFDKTRSGALKKITYPTKGYTEVTYEQNKVPNYPSNTNTNCSYNLGGQPKITESLIGGAVEQTIDTIITIPSSQIVKIYAYAEVGIGTSVNMMGTEASIEITTSGSLPNCNVQNIYINHVANGEDYNCEHLPGNPNNCDDNYKVDNLGGDIGYAQDAQIHITGRVYAPQGKHAKIQYRIYYEDTATGDKSVGGLRVAQTKDCSEINDCITTDYEYINDDGSSSGEVLGSQAIFSYDLTFAHEPNGSGLWSGRKYYTFGRSLQNFNNVQNAPALYKRVELLKNGGSNGKVVQHFSTYKNLSSTASLPILSYEDRDWKNGKLLKTETFKKQGIAYDLVRDTEIIYEEFFPYGKSTQSTLKAYNIGVAQVNWRYYGGELSLGDPNDYREKVYIEYPKAFLKTKSITKDYYAGNEVTSEADFVYNSPQLMLKEQLTTSSDGKTIYNKNLYPYNVYNTLSLKNEALTTSEFNAINTLKAQNRIASPVQVTTWVKDGLTLLSNNVQRTNFEEWGNTVVLPIDVQTLKGVYNSTSNKFQDRLTFHSYYNNGNIKEVSKKDGSKIVYIWGYNEQLPIAKIENASFSEVSSQLANLQTLSNNDNDRTFGISGSEGALRAALTSLRNTAALSDALVTTYTYDPLIGVTSITDPLGQTVYYHYDDLNRLEMVTDSDNSVLSTTEYNFKN